MSFVGVPFKTNLGASGTNARLLDVVYFRNRIACLDLRLSNFSLVLIYACQVYQAYQLFITIC